MSSSIVEPAILKGTRDFLPLDMAKRNFVMAKMVRQFERFGYNPIETPILSYAETILGKYGEEGDRLTYHFKDKGEREIALPYDLTVPTARYVAANWRELPIPFKRYQIQRVWRAEKPQKGRLREFYQCDIDTVGTRSLVADVEIAKVVVEVLTDLRFKESVVKFNSRRLINEILESLGLSHDAVGVIRILDKMDKIGREGVQAELKTFGLSEEKTETLFRTFESRDFSAFKTFSEIQEFQRLAKAFGIPENAIEFDPYLARGLDYYTGIIYEAVCPSLGMGSLAGGGRYDNLCRVFCEEDFPGVGVSFGFERIMLAMEELGLLKDIKLNSDVLITLFDEKSAEAAVSLFNQLIKGDVNAEIYFDADKLGKQFKYADKKGIPTVLVQGPEELQKGEVSVKNMETGEQKTLSVEALIQHLKKR
jgi:histidyl-tRNA synthetase